MRVMVLGAAGMLGQAVIKILRDKFYMSDNCLFPQDVNLCPQIMFCQTYSILDEERLTHEILTLKPTVIINCAAYTQVDRAEDEPDLAMDINGRALKALASLCKSCGIRLIHISTDYVFDGRKGNYNEQDIPNPINKYGESKLVGEQNILDQGLEDYLIIRTAGLYGLWGKNFVDTLLDKFDQGQREFKIVNDQKTNTTNTFSLAHRIKNILYWPTFRGIYHITDERKTTWYDLAIRIFEIAKYAKQLDALKGRVEVIPITSKEYGAKAVRPADSTLDLAKWRADSQEEWPNVNSAYNKALESYILDRYSFRWDPRLLE